MKKRGQMQLSFGMIFSIILIIAVVGVAFYVINNFLKVSKCAEVGLFYENLKKHTEKAWRSTIHEETFTGSPPSGTEEVCFGDISQERREEVRRAFRNPERNVFLYPPLKACDLDSTSITLEHVAIPRYFCKEVENGKITIKTSKTQFESLVTLSE